MTASAVLHLLTSEEVDRLATACVESGFAVLLTLTVIGRVEIAPSDPRDAASAAAFGSPQGLCTDGRRPLGPDAGAAAVDAFAVPTGAS